MFTDIFMILYLKHLLKNMSASFNVMCIYRYEIQRNNLEIAKTPPKINGLYLRL